MAVSRLRLALQDAPQQGRLLMMGATARDDLGGFDPARTQVVQGFYPDNRLLAARGFQVATAPDGRFDGAVVFVSRARAVTHARIAETVALLPGDGAFWVDGQKTDGVDAILRELRALTEVDEIQSRAHGKIFRVAVAGGAWVPQGWQARDIQAAPGMITRPGVFSADGPDPASQALAALLPEKLPTRIVELGCGWGWLGARILEHPGVDTLHMVEADATALDCARRNVTDPRAVFHWADALDFSLPEPVNGVIMNPPFHEGRAADPRLGAGFIGAAARLLTGAGRLWMVANRHLPYEEPLRAAFAEVAELGGDSRFKILTATGAGRGAKGQRQVAGRKT